MELTKTSFGFPVSVVTFNLRESINDRISLSWHLTSREKQKIINSMSSIENQKALFALKQQLRHN